MSAVYLNKKEQENTGKLENGQPRSREAEKPATFNKASL
jgi:hypothetical protein